MKKVIKRFSISMAIIFLACILGGYIWHNHLEYYWNTETLKLYQKEGIVRLCEGQKPVNPSWNPTTKNMPQIAQAEKYVKEELPITI